MKLRASLHAHYLALAIGLGLIPVAACSGSTTDGGAGGPYPFPCEDPTPILVDGQPTGWENCAGTYKHRSEKLTCPSELPRADGGACAISDPSNQCASDADCSGANAYCGQLDGGLGSQTCGCRNGCLSDADCSEGTICLCGSPVGRCVSATCTSDADCGDGLLCASYVSEPGCGGIVYACQALGDECASDANCTDGAQCTLRDGKRVCEQATCAIGRPFLVAGKERLASIETRGDWCAEGLTPNLDGLSPSLRNELEAHWTRIGLMEHAAVAAFARFALQLLAQGAPSELLMLTQAAIKDEMQHALICFGLASAYAGKELGPGAIDVAGALAQDDPAEILRMVVREGCIGETIATIEASEAMHHAADPAIGEILARIADDESRHAELAWRYVQWLIAKDPKLRATLLMEVDAALDAANSRADAESPEDAALLSHGVVSKARSREIRRRALREIVRPCAERLCDGHETGATQSSTSNAGLADSGTPAQSAYLDTTVAGAV